MKIRIMVKDGGKLVMIQSFKDLFKALESIKGWEDLGYSADLI